MSIGTMVYHTGLRMNLIVCQIDVKGKVICVNPNRYDNDVFQVITTDMNYLVKGWKAVY